MRADARDRRGGYPVRGRKSRHADRESCRGGDAAGIAGAAKEVAALALYLKSYIILLLWAVFLHL